MLLPQVPARKMTSRRKSRCVDLPPALLDCASTLTTVGLCRELKTQFLSISNVQLLKETVRRAKEMVDQHEKNAELKWGQTLNELRIALRKQQAISSEQKALVAVLQEKLSSCFAFLEKLAAGRAIGSTGKEEAERLLENLNDASKHTSQASA